MMDTLISIGIFFMKVTSILSLVFLSIFIGYCVYVIYIHDWIEYRKARRDIVPWVESYKRRCTGNNRFVVTPAELQNCFTEYDYQTIKKVWQYLISHNVIRRDEMDGEWVIK